MVDTPADDDSSEPFLSSDATEHGAIVVLDIVESVRLMEDDEAAAVARWQALKREIVQALPSLEGHLVKSLGDGLMLRFADAGAATRAALAIQGLAEARNTQADGVPMYPPMHLRIGAHLTHYVRDDHDIYGSGVNLAARLATLAGPGQVVVSSELRDQLTPQLDGELEDLGPCHLKHVKEPVRAWRVTPPDARRVAPEPDTVDLRPTLAVIPFDARLSSAELMAVGEVIAEGLIAQLSRSADLRVISRLSTTALRGRTDTLPAAQAHLRATYVLSGSYVAQGERLLVSAELADTRSGEVVWSRRSAGDLGDLLLPDSTLLGDMASAAHRHLLDREVSQALATPLPRLDSQSLLYAGIALMHRSSTREFERSREALDAVVERHRRAPGPRAWLAKWHIMRIVRGMSQAALGDARLAIEQTQRALDHDPQHPLALSFEGLARCQFLAEPEQAAELLRRAIAVNPNEPMAWLTRSIHSTMWGSHRDSVTEADAANALSPVDPLRYFFDMVSASALLTDGQHARAIEMAQRSLKANRCHSPTLRVLLTAQVEAGLIEDARTTLAWLLQEEPGLTLSSYLAKGSPHSVTRQRCAAALRALGVPEH